MLFIEEIKEDEEDEEGDGTTTPDVAGDEERAVLAAGDCGVLAIVDSFDDGGDDALVPALAAAVIAAPVSYRLEI